MLHLFAIFHLNLAYSSIEEAQRPEVVQRCYWPLLRLAERTNAPIGIEASGFTLEAAASIDPAWIEALRRLTADGHCEFVGSGYAQLIGPLMPAKVNAANVRAGHQVYERLLGFKPRLAFVNEQAYSAGLIEHYLHAPYEAIVMEWDNPARAHPDWDPEWRYFPQRAAGQHGETIPLIWNKAVAFQQFQRYAHDESSFDDYVAYLAGHLSDRARSFAMYGNDAEIFDFRPGRYRTETAIGGASEWTRIERAFEALARDERFRLIRPSQVLELMDRPESGHSLHLESPEDPMPVKKQRKYNITRWAVTGRDDLGVNTACWRIYERLVSGRPEGQTNWRDLCELWSSDYRTHITDTRWAAYRERLARLQDDDPATDQALASLTPLAETDATVARGGHLLTVRTSGVTLVLNCRRGLAIQALSFASAEAKEDSLCGTLLHGFYDDIHWSADFYTGMTVLESPGQPKITDLSRVEPTVGRSASGDVVIRGAITTDLGAIVKTIRVFGARLAVEVIYRLEWPEIPVGSLRLGDVTLNPRAFDRASLFYRCHNGGSRPDTFFLHGTQVAHSDPVSFLVSASHAIGITEGLVEVGDQSRTLRIQVDKTAAALVGMVTYQLVSDSYFCRISFSAAEVDETRRSVIRTSPLVCRFVLSPGSTNEQRR